MERPWGFLQNMLFSVTGQKVGSQNIPSACRSEELPFVEQARCTECHLVKGCFVFFFREKSPGVFI